MEIYNENDITDDTVATNSGNTEDSLNIQKLNEDLDVSVDVSEQK